MSQVELYNEEVRDLLSADDDNRKLKIFDDPKAKGCVIQGVEEVLVNNARDVIQIMQQGSNKRRVAATAMNPNSSRSHCVFCVTVHITPKGEDVLKVAATKKKKKQRTKSFSFTLGKKKNKKNLDWQAQPG